MLCKQAGKSGPVGLPARQGGARYQRPDFVLDRQAPYAGSRAESCGSILEKVRYPIQTHARMTLRLEFSSMIQGHIAEGVEVRDPLALLDQPFPLVLFQRTLLAHASDPHPVNKPRPSVSRVLRLDCPRHLVHDRRYSIPMEKHDLAKSREPLPWTEASNQVWPRQ